MGKLIALSGIQVTINEEDLKKQGVIYLLEFPNGKVYIGQTTMTLRDRLRHHCHKSNGCRKLKNAIDYYKEFKVSVLSSNLALEQLNVYEAFFIKAYNSTGKEEGYNLDSGGKNNKRSEETKKKLSDAAKGKKWSDETREKVRKVRTGEKRSENSKIRMSEAQKNRNLSDEGLKNITKRVKSIPDNIIFNSVKEAYTYYNINKNCIRFYYNGKIHKKSGQTFVLIESKEEE